MVSDREGVTFQQAIPITFNGTSIGSILSADTPHVEAIRVTPANRVAKRCSRI